MEDPAHQVCLFESVSVRAVNHVDLQGRTSQSQKVLNFQSRASEPHQDICALKVIPPIGSDLALTSNVPNIQPEAV